METDAVRYIIVDDISSFKTLFQYSKTIHTGAAEVSGSDRIGNTVSHTVKNGECYARLNSCQFNHTLKRRK